MKIIHGSLLNIRPIELLRLWGELVECYHGVNGYGSDTAEIYAYRLMPFSPSVQLHPGFHEEQKLEIQGQAAADLVELCRLFLGEYDRYTIEIDGIELSLWEQHIRYGFDWRVHVRVIKQ